MQHVLLEGINHTSISKAEELRFSRNFGTYLPNNTMSKMIRLLKKL